MRAKHFELVFTQFHHNYLIGWPNRFVDWDSGCNYNEKLRLHPKSLMITLRYCTPPSLELVDIDKLRMLHIRVYWSAWLEPVDPDVISTCHVLD